MINPDDVEFLNLSRGWKALVDKDVYERVKHYKWRVRITKTRAYAVRNIKTSKGQRVAFLHNYVLPRKDGMTADHKNTSTPFCVIDERLSNLRYATPLEQARNSRGWTNKGGCFKGTSWHKLHCKWSSQIRVNKKLKHLGYFVTEEAAALAYDSAALKYFGEFYELNFPESK